MIHRDYFQEFAPAILKIYRRNEEAFWTGGHGTFLVNHVFLLNWCWLAIPIFPGHDGKTGMNWLKKLPLVSY